MRSCAFDDMRDCTADIPASSFTTSVEQPCETSSALVSLDPPLCRWSGHKTLSMYSRYAIVDGSMHREGAALLDTWVQSGGKKTRPPRAVQEDKVKGQLRSVEFTPEFNNFRRF